MHQLKSRSALILWVVLASCAPPFHPSAISFYDDCATRHEQFIEIAECGKMFRNAYCESKGICSASGNAIVQYADSLAESVKDDEITDSEAKRKWIEFRMTQENIQKQQALQRAAIISAPTNCYTTGSLTHCY